MTTTTAQDLRRRFLLLTAFRWLPAGLLTPVVILLPLERGLTLGQLGLAAAAQGFVVLALELPTGGLADTLGRKVVLMGSALISIGSIGLFLVAGSFAAFLVFFALQGVYRALDSGPLEAWYVDASLAAEPNAEIERGLSGAGVVLGLSIAGGALAGGGLVAWDPMDGVDALALPVVLSLVLKVVGLLGIAVLMTEVRSSKGWRAAGRAARQAPAAIAGGLRLLRDSRVLLGIVAVELFWGFGMVTFESLTPVRLAEIVGEANRAAAIIGPSASAAWLVSAAGAAVVPWWGRRLGIAPAAALFRVLQGIAVVGIGFFGGVLGIIVAYLAAYLVHGASNPAHMTLLHRQVDGPLRATVVSLNSMISQPAGALGAVALTAVAEAASVSVAFYVGAAVLALAAPLYLPAWRQEQERGGAGLAPSPEKS
ncbi:MAG: MFS transporter [Acidimicrobiia bacterium]